MFAGIVDRKGSAERLRPPAEGYIRWVREGRGQTRETTAEKMEVTPQSLAGMEETEADGRIGIDTLRRAAQALNCTVVYAVIPNEVFEPRPMIQDVGAVLDEMAELVARGKQRAKAQGKAPADNAARSPIKLPVILWEGEGDPSSPRR
ncbi:hypothetical protein AXW83_03210 [Bosea sp. PAMC 26642]|nr:hypothetical protein AXW83_03210 [Bosea sp. PAMC 26642]